jgi:2'-5' RNA ligase
VRLFVALELPDTWREAAIEVRAALEGMLDPATSAALRWVQPELLHLTLRFLGEFPDSEVGRLQEALDRHVEVFSLDLSLAGVGRFGAAQRLRVLWLGVEGDLAGLRTLAAQVERACVEAGATPEARPPQPHITLARVRERAPVEARRAIDAAWAALEAPARVAFRAHEVVLVRSILGGRAPRYEVLSRHGAALRESPRAVDSEGGRNVDGLDGPA